ncbi:signal transducer and activator of transcription 5B isoform X2 [Hydra vulgaris]|uniref:signal transducer and activator of transcription 5B isoform X2 n=1 Tax=Hydra vulgaris TaxID=6087 RepID=UPI0032EA4AAA
MSVWNELINSKSRNKIAELYQKHNVHIEIRAIFADWFEGQNWEFNCEENIPQANDLLMQLFSLISSYASQAKDIITQIRFSEYKKNFENAFSGKPSFFVKTIQYLMREERNMIQAERNINLPPIQLLECGSASAVVENPDQFLHKLDSSIIDLERLVKESRNNQEDFILLYSKFKIIEGHLAQLDQPNGQMVHAKLKAQEDKKEIESTLTSKGQWLSSARRNILERLKELVVMVQAMVTFLQEELAGWRAMQQKSLSGALKPDPLDEIQKWFQITTDIMWKAAHVNTQFRCLEEQLLLSNSLLQSIDQISNEFEKGFSNLVQWSFLVDKQPKQVLKTQTKFQASVRLLIGSKLNQMSLPEVTVSILSEKQCKELLSGKNLADIGTCGEILNDKCVMELDKETSTLHAEFKNLQLKKIKRQDRKGQESVLEAKSALVFSAKLNLCDGVVLDIRCMTAPVVVVVHGNQGPNSEATIIWDNMFSVPNRVPFEVPEEVSWKEMAVALNARWIQTAEYELHSNHLLYLRDRIFSNITSDKNIISEDSMIPWTLFNKEPLKGRSFTFWEWFHGSLEVVRKHLKEHWKDQCLEFMTRQLAHKNLLEKQPGTFIIRFSDGELGAITIAWRCEVNGKPEVWYLQPWSSKDLTIRSLADRIFDLPELTHLYPDIPKEQAFGGFQTKEVERETDSSGYVTSGIVARIIHHIPTNQNAISPQSYDFNYSPSDLPNSSSSFSPFSQRYEDQDMNFDVPSDYNSNLDLFIKT